MYDTTRLFRNLLELFYNTIYKCISTNNLNYTSRYLYIKCKYIYIHIFIYKRPVVLVIFIYGIEI